MKQKLLYVFVIFCSLLLTTDSAFAKNNSTTTRVVIQWDETVTTENLKTVLDITKIHLSAIDAHVEITLRSFREKKHLAIVDLQTSRTKSVINALNSEQHITYAHEDILFSIDAQTTPWGIGSAGTNSVAAHTDGVTGSGAIVAIVDSGTNLNHPDLTNNIWRPNENTCKIYGETVSGGCPHGGYDFVNSDNLPQDDNGHGTHVAGIVAASDNNIGVVGVAPDATLMIVKVLDNTGYGSYTTIIEGIQFAIDNEADIINLSLGSIYDGQVPQALLDVIQAAEDAGIIVIAATGNNSSHVPYLPSQFSTVLSVGAIQQTPDQDNPDADYDTRLAYFSNWGKVDVVAPGTRINSTTYDGGYSGETWEGTSMATPAVAGVAALLHSAQPSLTPAQLRFIIKTTATDLGSVGNDDFFGAGLVNADAALSALESTTTTLLVEAAWSENSFENMSSGYYETTTTYSGRIPSDATSTSTVRIQLHKANGEPIINENIQATLSSGTILSTLPLRSNTEGIAYLVIQAPVTAEQATLTVTAGNTHESTDIIFANTLFVHDNGEPDDMDLSAWATVRALEENNVLWTQSKARSPQDSTELAHYTTVIWDAYIYGLNAEEQELLINFLRDGGHLAFFSGNALSTYTYYAEHEGASILGIDRLFSEYLGVTFVASHTSGSTLVGTNDLGNLSIDSVIAPADTYAQNRTDVIAAMDGSQVLGYFCDNAQDAIIAHENGYRSITVATVLELYSAHDRTTLLNRVLTALSGETNVNTEINETCDTVDDGATQNTHSPSDLSNAPETLSSEQDALSGVTHTYEDKTITIAWDPDNEYSTSEATLFNVDTHTYSYAEGDGRSITFNQVSPAMRYILALTVSSDAEDFNTYYAFITTQTSSISDITLSKKKRHELTISTTTALSENEFFEYEIFNTHNVSLGTIETTEQKATFEELTPRTTYHVRVRARSATLTGMWSEQIVVKTATNRVKRPALSPASANSLRVTWTKPKHSDVKKYRVQLFKKIDGAYQFYSAQVVTEGVEEEILSTLFSNLDPDHSYRVRIRPTFKNGEKGAYSLWRRILAKDF